MTVIANIGPLLLYTHTSYKNKNVLQWYYVMFVEKKKFSEKGTYTVLNNMKQVKVY